MQQKNLLDKLIRNAVIWGTAAVLGSLAVKSIKERVSPLEILSNLGRQTAVVERIKKPERTKTTAKIYAENTRENTEMDYQRLCADIRRYEDARNIAYDDSLGNRTIGVGVNLEEAHNRIRIEELGLNFDDVYNGNVRLTDEQINLLLNEDVETAEQDAKQYVGTQYWNRLNPDAREIITNMAFNLGSNRLSSFVRLRTALQNEDYGEAAKEMQNSRWYGQVGNRSKELVDRMRSLGD